VFLLTSTRIAFSLIAGFSMESFVGRESARAW